MSPDGTEVAYMFWPRGDLKRGEIRVAALDGGAVRALAGTPGMTTDAPAWSPDGTRSPTRSERSGFYELHLVGRDGAGERQLTSAGPTTPRPSGTRTATAWSAVRGRRNRFDLVVVDAATGRPR